MTSFVASVIILGARLITLVATGDIVYSVPLVRFENFKEQVQLSKSNNLVELPCPVSCVIGVGGCVPSLLLVFCYVL